MSRRRVSVKELGVVDCQGWMLRRKEGRSFLGSKWKRYWFVLTKSSLYWYTDKMAVKAEGFINLSGFTIEPAKQSRKKHAITASHPLVVTIFIAAESFTDMNKWISQLSTAAEPREPVNTEECYSEGSDQDADESTSTSCSLNSDQETADSENGDVLQPLGEPSTCTDPTPTCADPAPTCADPAPTGADPAPTGADPAPTGADPTPTGTDPTPTCTDPTPTCTDPTPTGTDPTPTCTDPTPTGEDRRGISTSEGGTLSRDRRRGRRKASDGDSERLSWLDVPDDGAGAGGGASVPLLHVSEDRQEEEVVHEKPPDEMESLYNRLQAASLSPIGRSSRRDFKASFVRRCHNDGVNEKLHLLRILGSTLKAKESELLAVEQILTDPSLAAPTYRKWRLSNGVLLQEIAQRNQAAGGAAELRPPDAFTP